MRLRRVRTSGSRGSSHEPVAHAVEHSEHDRARDNATEDEYEEQANDEQDTDRAEATLDLPTASACRDFNKSVSPQSVSRQ